MIDLTPYEFSLLKHLVAEPGSIFSRSTLIQKIQGSNMVHASGYDGYDRTIDFHIKNLRKKIKKYLPDQEVIKSIYGVGYKIVL